MANIINKISVGGTSHSLICGVFGLCTSGATSTSKSITVYNGGYLFTGMDLPFGFSMPVRFQYGINVSSATTFEIYNGGTYKTYTLYRPSTTTTLPPETVVEVYFMTVDSGTNYCYINYGSAFRNPTFDKSKYIYDTDNNGVDYYSISEPYPYILPVNYEIYRRGTSGGATAWGTVCTDQLYTASLPYYDSNEGRNIVSFTGRTPKYLPLMVEPVVPSMKSRCIYATDIKITGTSINQCYLTFSIGNLRNAKSATGGVEYYQARVVWIRVG